MRSCLSGLPRRPVLLALASVPVALWLSGCALPIPGARIEWVDFIQVGHI